MTTSTENVTYSVTIYKPTKKYNVVNVLVALSFSDQEKQIANCVTIGLADVDAGTKKQKLSDIISPRDRVVITAYDGEKSGEVFRGYIWDITRKTALTEADFSLKCYDNLIYWQESEDSDFFAEGRSTKDIMSTLADKWGIKMKYEYESITHEKLVLRGAIADFVTADVLDTVKDRTGKGYVIQSIEDTVSIKTAGMNETIYSIVEGKNAIDVKSFCTLNGVTTQVVILGKASDDAKTPVEATISGNTDTYGTLQKVISRNEDTTLEAAKEEANNIIKKDGKPKWEYEVKATDIPWVRKGDKIHIEVGPLNGDYIIRSIDREYKNQGKTMTVTVVDV